jgi:transcriptional regulator with XRE-family HTH domain
MDPLDAFATNVRRLRRQRGLTQERLAELADLHMTDIARIETQRREPGIRVVAKLAYGLGTTASELLEGVRHEPLRSPHAPAPDPADSLRAAR